MRLSDYLQDDLVLLGLEETGTEGVLTRIAADLATLGVGASGDEIGAALLERERTHPTSLGRGVAVPHAMVPGVHRTVLLIVRTDQPIPIEAVDDEPIRLLFVLISPPTRERDHIKLLARICRLMKQPGALDSILAAPDEQSVRRAVEEVDALHV